MRTLRQLHLYLGVVFAPLLIFFAVTGAWQLFDLHQRPKDGSYIPPRALVVLSSIHKDSHLPGVHVAPLRFFSLAAALGLIVTTFVGITLAYRFGRSPKIVTLCLVGGVVVPVALVLLAR